MLACVKAVLANLGSIWGADQIWECFAALAAMPCGPDQLSGFKDDFVQGSDAVFEWPLERFAVCASFSFMSHRGDLFDKTKQ